MFGANLEPYGIWNSWTNKSRVNTVFDGNSDRPFTIPLSTGLGSRSVKTAGGIQSAKTCKSVCIWGMGVGRCAQWLKFINPVRILFKKEKVAGNFFSSAIGGVGATHHCYLSSFSLFSFPNRLLFPYSSPPAVLWENLESWGSDICLHLFTRLKWWAWLSPSVPPSSSLLPHFTVFLIIIRSFENWVVQFLSKVFSHSKSPGGEKGSLSRVIFEQPLISHPWQLLENLGVAWTFLLISWYMAWDLAGLIALSLKHSRSSNSLSSLVNSHLSRSQIPRKLRKSEIFPGVVQKK